jgi:peptidoglycan/xylan/chitin deacetylase (PgdA/CDA1 family)
MLLSVLNYHSVSNNGDKPLSVKVAEFEKQMAYLKEKGYIGSSLEAARTYGSDGKKRVVLTFDDGYKDNYEHVLPVLRSHDFTATVYLTVNFINGNIPWHTREDVSKALNWKEIMQMMEYGIVFGSHTLNHPFLTKISDREAWKEIQESKDRLEQKLGVKMQSFAYPAGAFNNNIKAMVEKAGYEMAVALVLPKSMQEDRFCIPRTGISAKDTLKIFRFKLSIIFRQMKKWRLERLLRRR